MLVVPPAAMRLLLLVNILAARAADLLPDFHFSGAEKDRSHLRAIAQETKVVKVWLMV